MNAPEDALAEILAEHEYADTYEAVACSCGERLIDSTLLTANRRRWHRTHLAQVLAEWVAGEKARAWDEGWGAASDEMHPGGPHSTRVSNPYRLDPKDAP